MKEFWKRFILSVGIVSGSDYARKWLIKNYVGNSERKILKDLRKCDKVSSGFFDAKKILEMEEMYGKFSYKGNEMGLFELL